MRADETPRQVLIPILAVGLTIPALNYALMAFSGGVPGPLQVWEVGTRAALAPFLWLGYRFARWLFGLSLLLRTVGMAGNLALNSGSAARDLILGIEIALYLAAAGLLFFSRSAREHFAPREATADRATA
jgi:hypothetical protein